MVQEPQQDERVLLQRAGSTRRKLLAIAVLGGLALLLGTTVVSLQLILLYRQNLVQQRQPHLPSQTTNTKSSVPPETEHHQQLEKSNGRSARPMRETRMQDLFLYKSHYAHQQPYSHNAAAQHYWNQILPYLQQWDATLQLPDNDNDDSSTIFATRAMPTGISSQQHLWTSLHQAADLGHADAQFVLANYAASGIPPFSFASLPDKTVRFAVSNRILDSASSSHQLTQSLLSYHMAAMNGHVEAALALGYRQWVDTKQQWANLPPDECQRALPYYQAAANGIMDQLEADKHSRATVAPPMDGHVLSQLHAQGTHLKTGATPYNAPDEPAEALQFYHLRATQQDDVNAAYTLAQYYYHGIRGVGQNMTEALFYFDLASSLHHWESAGRAGMFHVWGLGMEWEERNLYKAHNYFLKGAPFGVDECRRRFMKRKTLSDRSQCDAGSLAGIGLLHVLGVPMVVSVDLEKAKAYLHLSAEIGNSEARYHLAMIRLGWKTYWVELDQLREPGDPDLPAFMRDSGLAVETVGPTKNDYQIAMNELMMASNKGHHLQAKHRLGMMYADGVNVTLSDGRSLTVINKDCPKALKHFHWLAEHANPVLSQRMRRAYEQYMSGDTEASLRNYIAAAETGNERAQLNAAFLLEQGVCLGMDRASCATASLRLWKGACTSAIQRNPEACLYVGDIFYYGRLRSWAGDFARGPGPFGWLPFILYPEKSLWPYIRNLYRGLTEWIGDTVDGEVSEHKTCRLGEGAGDESCLATTENTNSEVGPAVRNSDLVMAAQYYGMAARDYKNPRGNFNLGFMHEWGLGLKQDFPLAKRHYDLAASVKPGEADLLVQIALMAMKLHESAIKCTVAWKDFWNTSPAMPKASRNEKEILVPQIGAPAVGHPLPTPKGSSSMRRSRSKFDVVLVHLFSWDTLIIVTLTWLLTKVFQYRRTRR